MHKVAVVTQFPPSWDRVSKVKFERLQALVVLDADANVMARIAIKNVRANKFFMLVDVKFRKQKRYLLLFVGLNRISAFLSQRILSLFSLVSTKEGCF